MLAHGHMTDILRLHVRHHDQRLVRRHDFHQRLAGFNDGVDRLDRETGHDAVDGGRDVQAASTTFFVLQCRFDLGQLARQLGDLFLRRGAGRRLEFLVLAIVFCEFAFRPRELILRAQALLHAIGGVALGTVVAVARGQFAVEQVLSHSEFVVGDAFVTAQHEELRGQAFDFGLALRDLSVQHHALSLVRLESGGVERLLLNLLALETGDDLGELRHATFEDRALAFNGEQLARALGIQLIEPAFVVEGRELQQRLTGAHVLAFGHHDLRDHATFEVLDGNKLAGRRHASVGVRHDVDIGQRRPHQSCNHDAAERVDELCHALGRRALLKLDRLVQRDDARIEQKFDLRCGLFDDLLVERVDHAANPPLAGWPNSFPTAPSGVPPYSIAEPRMKTP